MIDYIQIECTETVLLDLVIRDSGLYRKGVVLFYYYKNFQPSYYKLTFEISEFHMLLHTIFE